MESLKNEKKKISEPPVYEYGSNDTTLKKGDERKEGKSPPPPPGPYPPDPQIYPITNLWLCTEKKIFQ
jgi:hypothetical protein